MRVAGARRFSKRSRGACAADRGDLISRWFGREGVRGSVPAPATEPARKRRLVDASRSTVPAAFNLNPLELDFLAIRLPREPAPILGYVTKPDYQGAVSSEDTRAREG
jgi:hypothetical protein